MKAQLYESLIEYSESNAYPFHMPGHKRQADRFSMLNPYQFDLTEIDGFDNLHEADGLIAKVQEKAEKLYGSGESRLLVNGSSGGILAAIATAFHPGDWVLVARNCHKSVYHALEINRLRPVYIWPEKNREYGFFMDISAENVKEALKRWPRIKGMILTSPTYEGIVSDIRQISKIIHDHGGICIVDEAHGAHLGQYSYFPESSIKGGADMVIQSLHKTMPALTQTGLIHVQGDQVDRRRLGKMLSTYQTSSPSYVLMASVDQCLTWALSEGKEAFEVYADRLGRLRQAIHRLKHIRMPEIVGADPSKLVLSVEGTNLSGKAFYDCLREDHHLQMEMVCGSYVLAMTSVCDTEEGFRRLFYALKAIDGKIMEGNIRFWNVTESFREPFSCPLMPPGEAAERPVEKVTLSQAIGHLSGDYIYQYPPGIPILAPGEPIDASICLQMKQVLEAGQMLHGGYDPEQDQMVVIKK